MIKIQGTRILVLLCIVSICSSHSLSVNLTTNSVFAQSQSNLSPEVKQAIELLQSDRLIEATELLQQAVKKNKDDAEGWQFLGVVLFRQGKVDDAKRAFDQSVRLSPNSAAPHNGLASCFLQLGKLRDAEKEAQQALKLNPHSDEARYFLAAVRLKDGDSFGAVEEVEKAIEANRSFAAAFTLKNQALIEIFSRVIDPSLQPNEGSEREQGLILAGLGFEPIQSAPKREAHIDQGKRFDKALEVIERSIQLTPQAQDAKHWQALAESLRYWKPWIQGDDKKPSTPVVVPIDKISSRPRILNAPEVRGVSANLNATAILLALLTDEGKVLHTLVTRRPGQGLVPLMLSVTEKITFIPATRDGKNVATVIMLKYKIAGGRVEVSLAEK